MAQMHIVTHITFFIAITCFIDFHEEKPDWNDLEISDYSQITFTLRFFQFGHIIQAATQISALFLKRYGYYNTAQWMVALATPICVLFPIIFGIYQYRMYYLDLTVEGMTDLT